MANTLLYSTRTSKLKLYTFQIARGILAGTVTGTTLSPEHCVGFGRQAILSGFYPEAVDWMQTAVKKMISGDKSPVDLTQAKSELEIAKKSVSLPI